MGFAKLNPSYRLAQDGGQDGGASREKMPFMRFSCLFAPPSLLFALYWLLVTGY
jgi:hypothetical protein